MAFAASAYRWSLVPVLTCAGFVSGLYTTAVIAAFSYGTTNPYPFTVMSSLCFGLTLGAVLWAFGFVPSTQSAVVLVAATVAIHVVHDLALESRIVAPLFVDVTVPFLGTVLLWDLVGHFLVAIALYATCLSVLTSERRGLWLVASAYAALTAIVVVVLVHSANTIGVDAGILSFPAQTTRACFLAVAIAMVGPETRQPQTRLAVVYILIVYCVAVFAGFDRLIQLPRMTAVARTKADTSAGVPRAPSRDNLPAVTQDAIEHVFLMDGVGGWRPYGSSASRLPADRSGGTGFQARPERVTYFANYARTPAGADDFPITVHVTHYPTAEWARFDVLNSIGRTKLPRLNRFGQNFYQDGPYFSWPSGDWPIQLECQGTPQSGIDEFLKAYLAKYPSDL